MDRDQYRVGLSKLFGDHVGHWYENPSPEDIRAITPHLTNAQRYEILQRKDLVFFALPPLEIRDAYLYVSYDLTPGGTIIQLLGAAKLRKPSSLDTIATILYKKEAAAYAEENWEPYLIVDTARGYLRTHLLDTSTLYPRDYRVANLRGAPTYVCTIHSLLSTPIPAILSSRTITPSSLWDRALMLFTADPLAGLEYATHGPVVPYFNCAYCGFGLYIDRCLNCGHQFREDKVEGHMGWLTPLPPKIVEYLQRERNHVFGQSPETGYMLEKELMRVMKPT